MTWIKQDSVTEQSKGPVEKTVPEETKLVDTGRKERGLVGAWMKTGGRVIVIGIIAHGRARK